MRRTASSERAGTTVEDTWGCRWMVRCTRAGVLPVPPVAPHGDAVRRLLLPWGGPAADDPHPAAPPAASWVLGRSARWQGLDAPGAGEDPVRDEALALRNSIGTLGPDSVSAVLSAWGAGALRRARQERTRPWLVQLCSTAPPARWATWEVAGPDAAQAAVSAVVEAVRVGRLPDPLHARLLDVRDDRG